MFFKEAEDVRIMTGKDEHLGWIKRSLHVCGICAYVKRGNYTTDYKSGLYVLAKDEDRARFLAKAYVASYSTDHLIDIDVEEVFGSMTGSAYESDNEFVG